MSNVVGLVFEYPGGITDAGTGQLLTDQGSIGLWNDNLLVVMDTGVYWDPYMDWGLDNEQFAMNTANWLASSTVVPIPPAIWLFGSGLIALVWRRRSAALNS